MVRILILNLVFLACLAGGARTAVPQVLQPEWTFPATGSIGSIHSSPTVYGNTVFVGSDDGNLYGITATGPQEGRMADGFPIALDGPIRSRPAVYGLLGRERVYVATTKGTLYAFRLDGTVLWSQSLSPGVPIYSTPAVRGDYVYVSASNGRIYRRRVSDGSEAGGLTFGRVIVTSLAQRSRVPPSRNYLEVADARGFFDVGRVRVTSDGPFGDPVSLDYSYSGRNLTTSPHRLLNVMPLGAGPPMIFHPTGSRVVGHGPGAQANASPAVPSTEVSTLMIAALEQTGAEISSLARNLVAVKAESYGLVPQWEAWCGPRIAGSPVIDEADGAVYVTTWNDPTNPGAGGNLVRISAANGTRPTTWGREGVAPVRHGSPVAEPWLDTPRGLLFAATTGGALYTFDAKTGEPVSQPALLDGAAVSFTTGPTVVGDRVYIGSVSGRFYSLAVSDPNDYAVYISPDNAAIETTPSASGPVSGRDVIVVGTTTGRVLAFTLP
ncbi:MAG: PQQ-binding-like beta-propeller repeat protein [Armatimonadetes bacterium]|nr:PQQ-binding-like beta-propeller repeat protein [Armatimonadota bacterium]